MINTSLLSGIKVLQALKNERNAGQCSIKHLAPLRMVVNLWQNRSWGHILYRVLVASIQKQFTLCLCPRRRTVRDPLTSFSVTRPCFQGKKLSWQYKHQAKARVRKLHYNMLSLPFYSKTGVGSHPLSRLRMSVPRWVVVGIELSTHL